MRSLSMCAFASSYVLLFPTRAVPVTPVLLEVFGIPNIVLQSKL